jgi:Predicted permease, DMT superfamily
MGFNIIDSVVFTIKYMKNLWKIRDKNMTNYKKGFIYVLVATSFWGFTGVAAKMLFSKSINPLVLVQVRLTASALILFLYLFLFSRKKLKVDFKDLPYFASYGILGLSAVQFTYLFTMSRLDVGLAVFFQALSPVFIFSFMILSGAEKVNRRKLTCVILSVTGCYFMMFGFNGISLSIDLPGLISGLLSGLFAAFYTLYSRRGLLKYSPWTLLTYGLGFGALFWWFIVPPWKVFQQGYDWTSILFFLYIAVFSTVVPFGLYFMGLSFISPSTASIINTFEPFLATVLAFLILKEKMTAGQIVGAAFVLLSILMLNLPQRQNEKLYVPPGIDE